MKKWLGETHGIAFELVRHFVMRFFDSDLVAETGQWAKVMVTAFALILPAFFLMANVLVRKYRYFSHLPGPEGYQNAVHADQLWLITLTMSVVGLLTAVQWQNLFPGKRDYLALGTLPIKPRQIFLAKFLALFLMVSALTITLIALPSLLFPIVSMGRWQTNPALFIHIAVHAAVCVLGAYFTFFSLLGMQGVLLNVFRPLWFSRITSYLQGAMITLMLAGIVMSFSIGPEVGRTLLQPQVARWLPPAWMLGLYQQLFGDHDAYFGQLAQRALIGFGAAFAIATASYLMSYGRHRELAVEGLPPASAPGKIGGWLLDIFVPNPRQQGVVVFMAKTLERSAEHRMVLMGYVGLSLAIILTGIAGMKSVMKPDRLLLEQIAFTHMVLLLFLATGLRKVFAIPSELRANWTFQVKEQECREEWLRAVDSIATWPVLFLIVALPAPVEIALLGWRGAAEVVLVAGTYLLLYESLFYSWQKLPFTCSYVPGQVNGFVVVFRFFSVLSLLPVVHRFLMVCLSKPVLYVFVLTLMSAVSIIMRRSRRDSWSYTPLRFAEEPEPVVRSLKLGTA